jgi:hypothetical protein
MGCYDTIKHALFEGFQLTEDEYRKKFRQTKKCPGETYKEYITKLDRYLDKWVELAECDTEVDDLKELILKEQVLENLPPDLAIYVKDRRPKTSKEIGEIATTYYQARSGQRAFSQGERSGAKNQPRKSETSSKEEKGGYARLSEEEKNKLRAAGLCFKCKQKGHRASECPSSVRNKKERVGAVRANSKVEPHSQRLDKLCKVCEKKQFSDIVSVKIDGKVVTALRDSGCSGIMVSADLVPKEKMQAKMKQTTMAEKGMKKDCHTAIMHIDSPYFKADTEVTVLDDPICPVLIGKWYGVEENRKLTPVFPVRDPSWYKDEVGAVSTRAQEKENSKPTQDEHAREVKIGKFSPTDLRKAQKEDPSLRKIRQFAEKAEEVHGIRYEYKDDILYRISRDKDGCQARQVVVPKSMRKEVLTVGHDLPTAGHLGIKKSSDRIRREFWWPGCGMDIKRHCQSCDVCQRTTPKGRVKHAPLGKMPVVDTAFKRVAVDLIGPIKPMSEDKKQYILVMIDYNTRYPEAVALKDIKAETVTEALFEMWSRLGIPDEVVTDQGSQFSGELMREVNKLLDIKHHMTTPFHPMANGLVEKMNGSLKSMLRKLSLEQPEKWPSFLPSLLFAYREAPHESLLFSPFELLFGRAVKGPMQILRKIWTDDKSEKEEESPIGYVIDLRSRIEETCKIARENLAKASQKQKLHFDRKAKKRTLDVGSKVLLLLPIKKNKLQLSWRGPYKVVERLNDLDYRIQIGKKTKVYHINLLKEYVERDKVSTQNSNVGHSDEEDELETESVAVVIDESQIITEEFCDIPTLQTMQTENIEDIHFSDKLTARQKKEAKEICAGQKKVWSDVPSTTQLETCEIKVTEKRPVYVRPRPVPHALVDTVEKEVDQMLKLGVIEPACSPYNNPIVLVKKKEGSYRFCADMRRLNDVTEFDGEPLTDVDHLFSSLGKAKYFSKLDLTKGYWSIPIDEKDKEKTAFTTTKGQFQYKNMCFGLKSAAGVFNRMMRKLLIPLKRKDVHHFMDDILIASETWEEHMEALKAVVDRLAQANLSAKPSKCFIGFSELPYLGHEIGAGKRWPEADKIEKVRSASLPETKKELRSFLGLSGFYRQYIKDYSEVALPLTDMTKKKLPEKLKWSHEAEQSFKTLKEKVCQKPVLSMPDFDKPFVLRTDASNRAVGAVLMQEKEGILHPIAYQSRKLNEAESRYSTVEKECLASVWAIAKFERFLYGTKFVLETDHQPLKGLQKQPSNPRLMRWSLFLQNHDFVVKVIPGRDNHGADYLSRARYD